MHIKVVIESYAVLGCVSLIKLRDILLRGIALWTKHVYHEVHGRQKSTVFNILSYNKKHCIE